MNSNHNEGTSLIRKHASGCFGTGLAKAFSVRPEIAAFPTVPWIGDRDFALTRIKTTAGLGTTTFSPEAAILLSVAVDPVPQGLYQVWIDGKEVECLNFPKDGVALVDLQSSPALWADCPVDFHHFYIPHAELIDIAREHGIPALGPFGAFHGSDLVIASMASLLTLPSAVQASDTRLRLDCAKLILGSHLIQQYAGVQGYSRSAPVSKLAPWQKSRSMSMLRENVATSVRLADVANECGLSPSHFARCFKATFGTSVHQSLIRLRVDAAQHLLARTRKPIAEIAMQAGFSDQAALTRTFKQLIGTSPARWRKDACTL